MRDVQWLSQRSTLQAELSLGRPAAPAPRADGLACLLVEPQESVREAFSGLLRSHGMVVRCASSYVVGLALGTTLRFDVVLTELALPDGDGRALAAALKRSPEGRLAALGVLVMDPIDNVGLAGVGFDCAIGRLARPAEIVAAVRALALVGARRRAGARAEA